MGPKRKGYTEGVESNSKYSSKPWLRRRPRVSYLIVGNVIFTSICIMNYSIFRHEPLKMM